MTTAAPTTTRKKTPTPLTPGERPDAYQLTPVLSEKYAMSWRHVVVCAWFAALVIYTNHAPLSHSETWRLASIGRHLATGGGLQSAHHAVPLMDGLPYASGSSFGRVALAYLTVWGGAEALSTVTTGVVLLTFLIWGNRFFQATGRKRWMLLGLTILFAVWLPELNQPSPRLLSGLFFAVWIALVSRALPWSVHMNPNREIGKLSWATWVSTGLIFFLWASCDHSALIGVGLVVAITLGTIIDSSWMRDEATHRVRIRNPFQDRHVRTWIWLTELAVVATLISPAGWELWRSALVGSPNPVFTEWGGWMPLPLASLPGIWFAALWLCLLLATQRSCRALQASELLPLLGLSVLTAINFKTLVWLAPVALLIAGYRAFAARISPTNADDKSSAQTQPQPLGFAGSLVCLLLIWMGFALSPMSNKVLGSAPRVDAKLHAADTPLEASRYLRNAGLRDLIWAPSYWSDWLIWDGPPQAKFFTDSHVWQLPKRSRFDYLGIYRGAGNWQRIADRYAIRTLVVDKKKQSRLAAEVIRSSAKWELMYEDEQAMILSRVGI